MPFAFLEALRFSYQALAANKLRTLLTALGLVIGNASVILVVTISLTSRDYILEQISATGSNLVFAYFDAGNRDATAVAADLVKVADIQAVRDQLGDRIAAATGVMVINQSVTFAGRTRDLLVLGTDDQYARVRNLVQIEGRGLSPADVLLRQRVAVVTEDLGRLLFGSAAASLGQILKISDLQFTVVGVFREKTDTFGLSELARQTILVPVSTLRQFVPIERIDPMYVQALRAEDVPAITEQVRRILEARHRPGATYFVGNLASILEAAQQVSLILLGVLIVIAAIALTISGIGIMNIMLVTVRERTREIGVRLAMGATRRAILLQFLIEAALISIAGGFAGVVLGTLLPLLLDRALQPVRVQISPLSIFIAFGTSFLVGITFGLLPARRAAAMNPTEALRYE